MTADVANETRVRPGLVVAGQVRARSAGYLRAFLRAPLGWVVILSLLGTVAAHGMVRERNRLACAAVSMDVDRQSFRGVINGIGGGMVRVVQACAEFATPDTVDAVPRVNPVKLDQDARGDY